MFTKIFHFLKYNNLTVIILALVLIVGASAFAATDAGQAAIGQQTTRVEGTDNTALLAAALDTMNFDFKIEKIEQDVDYYYVTFTYLDLIEIDHAWQYQLTEKTRKVTKKIKQDLGAYLAEEFKQTYAARLKELKEEQAKALAIGPQAREEVTEYTGLIGKTLDLAASVFPNYEPVKKRELPSPDFSLLDQASSTPPAVAVTADNLANIYNQYINQNDPDNDNVFGANDNCPLTYNPDQKDTDADGVGDVCDIDQMGIGAATTTAPAASTEQASTTPADSPVPSAPPASAPTITPDIIIPLEPAPMNTPTEAAGTNVLP